MKKIVLATILFALIAIFAIGATTPAQAQPGLMLYNSSLQSIGNWAMTGPTVTKGTNVSPALIPGWSLVCTGDVDGDGESDAILENDNSREIAVWLIKNGQLAGTRSVTTIPAPGWTVKAAADFDSDGRADLVLQSDSGSIGIWILKPQGATNLTVTGFQVNVTPQPGWLVVAAGRVVASGSSPNIVLQYNQPNQPPRIGIWTMNGSNLLSGLEVAQAPALGWRVAAIGNYDQQDSGDDIVIQNPNGQSKIWKMRGINLVGTVDVSAVAQPGWEIRGAWNYIVTPSAPNQLAATANSPNQVALTWGQVSPAQNYKVYRGSSAASLTFQAQAGANSWVDNSVSGGTTYYYAVSAVNQGREGPRSNVVSVTTPSLCDLTFTQSIMYVYDYYYGEWYQSNFPAPGQPVQVVFYFANAGKTNSKPCTARITLDSGQSTNIQLPAYQPNKGDSLVWIFYNGFSEGGHYFDAYLDTTNQNQEITKANNQTHFGFSVQ